MPSVLVEMRKTENLYTGLGNFSLCLGKSLLKYLPNNLHPIFYVPRQCINLFNSAEHRILRGFHRYFPQFAPRADLWHLPYQNAEIKPPNKNIPLVYTIHDLNFLHQGKSLRSQRRRMRKLLKESQRATFITTISNFCKQEIEQYLQPKVPVKVIYNGIYLQPPVTTQPAFIPNEPYLMTLGDVYKKKNFMSLVKMLVHVPEYPLVIVGRGSKEYATELKKCAQRLKLDSRVILTGAVTEAEKTWIYQNCEAFLFPSLAEGFGLPVIEAMRCGKPVFLSQLTALPEVGGQEAYYFENFEPLHMAEVLIKGLQDFKNDRQKSQRLIRWSQQFNWDHAAQQYVEVYRRLLGV